VINLKDKEDIAIIGMMASGKTTIGKKIANELGYTFFEESFEGCPTLEAFYQDPANWALETEVWFLLEKARQHKQIRDFAGSTICDSPIQTCIGVFIPAMYEDGFLSLTEYNLLNNLYDEFISQLTPKPDKFIYLNCTTETLMDRIKKRGRSFEQNCNESYLDSAIRNVNNRITGRSGLFNPVLIVDGNQSIDNVICDILDGMKSGKKRV
jgi:deoxyadenosine/deoxycytidine kinase